jgi:NodT family efflux transporter outer membrane factor (OMF) lipoprotein
VSSTPSRTKRNFIGFPAFGGGNDAREQAPSVTTNTSNQFNLSLNLNWELDLWGRIAAGRSAAQASFEAAELDYKAARASLAGSVARAWFALSEAQAQLQLAEQAQQTFAETANAVRDRFKAGADQSGAASQLRLSETDVATAKANLAERQLAVQAAARQLEILLGRYPAGSMKGSATLPAVPRSAPTGLPSELLLRRPDILAAERRHAAQGKRVTEGWKSLYPRFTLTGSAGQSSQELVDILKSDFGVWQIAGNIVQPILAGGRIIGEIKVYYAEEKETLGQLESTLLKAFGEVEGALASERDLATRETAVLETLRLAKEAEQSARTDYRNGVGDILTVLAAQGRRVTTEAQSITLHRLRLDNRINLHLALGGDFKINGKIPDLPVAERRSALKTWWKRQKKTP